MKTKFLEGFKKDLSKLDKQTLARVLAVVSDISAVNRLADIANIKKIKGPPAHFRVRVGDMRIGFRLEMETAIFMRCLPRDQIYRSFP